MKYGFLLGTVCLLSMAFTSHAHFFIPELEEVPTDRLLTNLTQRAKEDPKDVQMVYALARVHAMAYAKAQSTFKVARKGSSPFENDPRKEGLPYFGPQDRGFLPRETAAPTNTAARSHLDFAIRYYSQALEIQPDHLPSEVGLGWCQDQAGKKKEAIQTYRKALDQAWRDEKKSGHIFQSSIAGEICDYLLPLMDPKADAAEIKRVTQIKQEAQRLPRSITPLIVPLEDGLSLDQLVDLQGAVPFDLDGSGVVQKWQWPTPQVGWLAYDPSGAGDVRSGLQLFGAVTFWIFWENGYEALASLDNDQDGFLRGAELEGLVIWRDTNSNGVSEPGEVQPLSYYGITGLACGCQRHQTGIPYNPAGVVFEDGHTRPTFDWVSSAK